jgi:hypothetical protein
MVSPGRGLTFHISVTWIYRSFFLVLDTSCARWYHIKRNYWRIDSPVDLEQRVMGFVGFKSIGDCPKASRLHTLFRFFSLAYVGFRLSRRPSSPAWPGAAMVFCVVSEETSLVFPQLGSCCSGGRRTPTRISDQGPERAGGPDLRAVVGYHRQAVQTHRSSELARRLRGSSLFCALHVCFR